MPGSSPEYDCGGGGCGDWLTPGVLFRLTSWLPDFGGGTGGVCSYIFPATVGREMKRLVGGGALKREVVTWFS